VGHPDPSRPGGPPATAGPTPYGRSLRRTAPSSATAVSGRPPRTPLRDVGPRRIATVSVGTGVRLPG
jgi:hypothetical protein